MNNSEPLRFGCPACGQHIECSPAWAGVELDCPTCAKRVRAPLPVAMAMPQEAPSSTRPPALPALASPTRAKPTVRTFPFWIEQAGTYGVSAPMVIFGLGMAAHLIPRSMEEVSACLVLFLFVSGSVAALVALVHFFLCGKGLLKALVGIGVNLLLGMSLILPATQRAWQRHREIQWEKASGVRQLHEQGVFYMTNRALPPSERGKAVELLTVAAKLDYRRSQYSLGYCYKNGIGVSTNRVMAWKWLTIAANKGSAKAPGLLNKLQAEMSPEEIAEGQRLVEEFATIRKKAR
jgi:hypothetical protein